MGAGLQRAKKAAAETRKQPKPYRSHRYGILNPWGDVWTPETFNSIAEAQKHLDDFWRGQRQTELAKFSVVLVRVTISAIG